MITLESAATPRLSVRAIRLVIPVGTASVVLTHLMEAAGCSADAVIALYFRRWVVETHYRDEKTSLDIETFHSQTENGIRQELLAMLIMAVSTRLLMRLRRIQSLLPGRNRNSNRPYQLGQEAAVLTPHCPQLALVIFSELLQRWPGSCITDPKSPDRPNPVSAKNPSINGKWSDPNEWRGLKSTALSLARPQGGHGHPVIGTAENRRDGCEQQLQQAMRRAPRARVLQLGKVLQQSHRCGHFSHSHLS